MNNNRVDIIVIMPVYNGEKYIDNSINSILWQTFINLSSLMMLLPIKQ